LLNQVGRKEIMSLSDPIGDMIARVKNAQARNHKKVELPSSNFKSKIADILKNEGFIKDCKILDNGKKPILTLELKYHSGNPVISNFERISKPGRRIFSSADSLPKINNGLGIAIVSTPKGVMTDMDARKQKVGGEIICKVF
jgi:small subunit ribosomal protein S8